MSCVFLVYCWFFCKKTPPLHVAQRKFQFTRCTRRVSRRFNKNTQKNVSTFVVFVFFVATENNVSTSDDGYCTIAIYLLDIQTTRATRKA